MTSALLHDYARWHELSTETGDIDPAYPVLRHLTAEWTADERAWLILYHVAFYHLGSALRAFDVTVNQLDGDPARLGRATMMALPKSTERRGLRVIDRFVVHWSAVRTAALNHGGPAALLRPSGTGTAAWNEVHARMLSIAYNGRWAAYKLTEMSQKVLGNGEMVAPDAAHAASTGPRKGLCLLYPHLRGVIGNTARDIAVLDDATEILAATIGETDLAAVETSLCDFHSAMAGRHYIGRDIDDQLHQLTAVPSGFTRAAIVARKRSFPYAYLGENGDRWHGVDGDRCKVYRDSGRIVLR